MQSLYSYFQQGKTDTAQFEKEMFKNLDRIYDLYLLIFALLADLQHVALMVIDENRNKRLPTRDDLEPNTRFANNSLLVEISRNEDLKALLAKRKISWQNDFDVVRKIFSDLRHSKFYKAYMAVPKSDFSTEMKQDREFLITLITDHLSQNERLNSIFEERNMHWADDAFVAYNSVIRTIEDFKGVFKLQPLLKDEKDDLDFMSDLFNKTILYRDQFDEMIDKQAKNWELERIASMDMLLMEMALTEILHIPSVPVKASLNEYIDISKEYSTPNSKVFVNGVLDKLIGNLKKENKISKTGRGLKES